jgi:hypothetical protein
MTDVKLDADGEGLAEDGERGHVWLLSTTHAAQSIVDEDDSRLGTGRECDHGDEGEHECLV